jgi:hypothetical protein
VKLVLDFRPPGGLDTGAIPLSNGVSGAEFLTAARQ